MGVDLTLSVLRSSRPPVLGPFGPKAARSLNSSLRAEPAKSTVLPCRRAGAARKSGISTSESSVLTEGDIPRLRESWLKKTSDITGPIPSRLPPLQEMNHSLKLIEPNSPIKHQYSKCPDALCPLLMEKIN